jgi:peptide deformylase
MKRDITKDEKILTRKSEPFILGEDDYLIQDLIDTANEHKETCAGLACIQIGIAKRIIVVRLGENYVPYINPIIFQKSNQTYTTQEGCLSVEGTHTVKRHHSIKLIWTTPEGQKKMKEFKGWIAQVIQHEVDHLNGILI